MLVVKEEEIKERWETYFDILFNGSHTKDWSIPSFTQLRIEIIGLFEELGWSGKWRIEDDENKKNCGPDELTIVVWKCLVDEMKRSLSDKKMSSEWRKTLKYPYTRIREIIKIVQINVQLSLWVTLWTFGRIKIVEIYFDFIPRWSIIEVIYYTSIGKM